MAQALDLIGTARSFSSRLWLLIAVALASFAVASLTRDTELRMIAGVAGLTFAGMVIVSRLLLVLGWIGDRRLNGRLRRLIGQDASPCFSTDALGRIGFQNAAAAERFGEGVGSTLLAALKDHFASPASVLYRLQCRAAQGGSAREDVATRRGHTRLSVHRIGKARFLWRLEEFLDRPGQGRGAETLSLPMLIANKAGVVLFSNEAMRRLLGRRPDQLDSLFVSGPPRPGEEVEIRAAEGQLRALPVEIAGPGERREVYLLPAPCCRADDEVMADFEHLPVALLKFEGDGGLHAANRAARDLLWLAPGAEAEFADLFEGLGRSVSDWLADVATERSPGGAEVLRLRRAEEDVFLQITLRRIVERGRPAVLAVLNDATALKTLEAQFVQSQKMQAIGQLAGGIAHDFNNLLTAISGHCDLLLLRHEREDPEYADLVQIHQNANRAASLVGQLLAFSRKQTLQPERVDLQEVLSDLTHLLNRLVGERVSLRLSPAADLGPIRADKRQLEQVLMNLVVNARDAMPEGGVIRISTEAVTLTEELRRDRAVVPAGNYALIHVQDTGTGIPADRLQKIFEPFYTTKRPGEGTGLGLSTAYGIVKQSGGFIFVDSEPGEGSVFHLYFPIHDLPLPEPARPAPAPRAPMRCGEGVVLLVEDEAPVRAFASRALRMRGFTVLEAENAEEALHTLEDSALEVDVFVTDVVMPGMDGPTWVRRALEDRPEVRVVFVSGYAEECLAGTKARIPNSVFLPKPFSLTELTATVQGQLQ
ncbi:two-component system cell cycle sensor histidine kinase/response regulator CckA [Cereibacter changlensis]|uniref:histidine kinase n=1 Tax=Cereibacter changlensis TaxID=402884 RepID=A0A2W7RAE9_9RHOB|nr:two-component system cell cycle sensor histidine kinase/response regulator CckA [Cereibacter changlensis]